MRHRGFLLLSLLALLALTSAVAKKKNKVKKDGPGIECTEEWAWGPCTLSSKDCGVGFREGSCGAPTQRIGCRIPCNWKEFGADCK
ncbi:Midkine [Plecturocebus cupreus]